MGLVRLWRWWFSDERKVKQLLRSAVTVRIADAEDGAMVKIVGKVKSAGKSAGSRTTRPPAQATGIAGATSCCASATTPPWSADVSRYGRRSSFNTGPE